MKLKWAFIILFFTVSCNQDKTKTQYLDKNPDLIQIETILKYGGNSIYLTTIPKEIKLLKNHLKDITVECAYSAENNSIIIPPEIGDFSKLEDLCITGCKQFKLLPTEIGKLKKLETLILWGTGIIELPKEVENLHNLKRLELAGCKNLKLISVNFDKLLKLENYIFIQIVCPNSLLEYQVY